MTSRLRAALPYAFALLLLHLVLIQPNHPQAMTARALFVLALELPALVLLLIALPAQHRATAVIRGGIVAALTAIAVLKTADYLTFTALARGFNPIADWPLGIALLRLTAGAFGPVAAGAMALCAVLAIAGLAGMLWWATGVWSRLDLARRRPTLAALGAMAAAGIATAEIGAAMGRWTLPVSPPGAAFTARVGVERIGTARTTLADLRQFRDAAALDPFADAPVLLDRIDRDLLVIWVESYGRGALDRPRHRDALRTVLTQAEARLGAAGLAMRSGWLAAPTRGGQSWLSHATFAQGLWIDSQTRHAAALASGRAGLFHIAQAQGARTAAVMPAITLHWPEAARMGFDTVLGAGDLGYAGPPFNWVTMPDQFTLAALDRLLRQDPADPPLVAQIALISSHAPWVPVPDLVAWDAIGDGSIYAPMAARGDPPDVVWRDRNRVRTQYGKALAYALQSAFAYAERHADDPPLIVLIGDHQPAPFVTGDTRPDVPVHLIGPQHLVDAATLWGWGAGLVPPPEAEVRPMSHMRDLLLRAYSSGAPIERVHR